MNLDNGKTSAFIVAEVGPSDAKWGNVDCPGAGAGRAEPNPRTGAGKPDGKIAYVVFPKSRANPAWPLTNQQIGDRVQDLLKQLPGGMETLKACGADAK